MALGRSPRRRGAGLGGPGVRRGFPWPLIKILILAGCGVVGSVWALQRAYRPRPPMVVPASQASTAPSGVLTTIEGFDGQVEILAPEVVPMPSSSASR